MCLLWPLDPPHGPRRHLWPVAQCRDLDSVPVSFLPLMFQMQSRQAGTRTLCPHACNACTWTHLSWSNRIWSNYKGLKKNPPKLFSPVQSLSHIQLFVTPWTTACQASLSITNSQSLLKLMSIESVMPSNHLFLCHPLLLLLSISPSIRVLSNESVLRLRWPKYWSFSFNINLSNEYNWFPLGWTGWIFLQSKGLSSLQHRSSTASIVQCSDFFTVQLSHPYMETQPEWERETWGDQYFEKLIPILYFPWSTFIHWDVMKKSRGVSSPRRKY